MHTNDGRMSRCKATVCITMFDLFNSQGAERAKVHVYVPYQGAISVLMVSLPAVNSSLLRLHDVELPDEASYHISCIQLFA